MRYALLLPLLMLAAPAQADGLSDLIGTFETKAKSKAFDAAIESQAPGLGGITKTLSDDQKAQLFDLGVENADTIGKVGAAVGGLGGGATAGTLGSVIGTGSQAAPVARPTLQTGTIASPAPVYENIGTIMLD